jgi:hypothetical protein
MQRFAGEAVLTSRPAAGPESRAVFVELHEGLVHVLTWDRSSIYPRQTLIFDRMAPPEVAAWLRALAGAVDEAGGRAQAEGGTAAAGKPRNLPPD